MRGIVFIGYDPREDLACRVAALSIMRRCKAAIDVRFLRLADLQRAGLYRRALRQDPDGRLWDVVSDAPMTTEHAVARFFMPYLVDSRDYDWALFMDGDVVCRTDIARIFEAADDRYALMCVQHNQVLEAETKKGGQAQTAYNRKNWSSVMLWNLHHRAHARLTLEDLNVRPGRELHRFCWLADSEIGALDPTWNYLVGEASGDHSPMAKIVHYTLGLPYLPGLKHSALADIWWKEENNLCRGEG